MSNELVFTNCRFKNNKNKILFHFNTPKSIHATIRKPIKQNFTITHRNTFFHFFEFIITPGLLAFIITLFGADFITAFATIVAGEIVIYATWPETNNGLFYKDHNSEMLSILPGLLATTAVYLIGLGMTGLILSAINIIVYFFVRRIKYI